ncbi:hypothetical protein CYY_002718 [Polysphondylium violaceum]|uniref:CBS domain-containing protein n=1 Tax=Polysphondylium violaceum TaxID=133409 RepID=A0A8J4V6L8_9MYCE|nr:hypothetical protein CYY_002718 [Polysphondylium violaceum]
MEKFLNSHLISEMLDTQTDYWKKKKEKSLITLEEDAPVSEALKLLSSNFILSLPIKEKGRDDYLGFIDMNDILHSIIKLFLEKYPQQDRNKHWEFLLSEDNHNGKDFIDQQISSLINQSKLDNFIPVDENGTLFQLIDEVFSLGIHRVIAVDESATVKGLISQTDILKYILENLKEIGIPEFDKPVRDLGIIDKDIIFTNEKTLTIQTYYIMLEKNAPCIGLTNDKGEFIGNLSITDLRGLAPPSFRTLLYPSVEFWNLHSKKKKCKVSTDTSLRDVLNLLYTNRLHRLWVVDEGKHQKCYGVISLSNIMRYFSRYHDKKAPSFLSKSTSSCATSRLKSSTNKFSPLITYTSPTTNSPSPPALNLDEAGEPAAIIKEVKTQSKVQSTPTITPASQ